jgi:hypothetical protein
MSRKTGFSSCVVGALLGVGLGDDDEVQREKSRCCRIKHALCLVNEFVVIRPSSKTAVTMRMVLKCMGGRRTILMVKVVDGCWFVVRSFLMSMVKSTQPK